MSELDTQFRQDHTPAATVLSAQEQRGLTVRVAPPPTTRIGAQHAALGRMIGQGLHVSLPAIEARLSIHLTADDQRTVWPDALTLSGPDGAFEIEEGARLLRVLTGIDIEVSSERDDGNAEWLLSAVLGRLAGTPFASCDRITRKAPLVSKQAEVLRVVVRSGRHLVSTDLRADAATWVSLLARTNWSPARQPLSSYASLAMQIRVQIGSHVLSAGRLRTLAAGDILLPESTSFNVAGEGWLPFGGLRIHARYSAPGTLTVLDVVRHPHTEGEAGSDGNSTISRRVRANMSKGKKMEEHHDEGEKRREQAHGGDGQPTPSNTGAAGANDADESGALDAVGVTLYFELGKAQMTLGEIRTLAAGSIVLFAGGSPESVAIVSSGRTLGRGEAVDVEGRLGIRITQWGNEGE
jgi:type III secretion protein Q